MSGPDGRGGLECLDAARKEAGAEDVTVRKTVLFSSQSVLTTEDACDTTQSGLIRPTRINLQERHAMKPYLRVE